MQVLRSASYPVARSGIDTARGALFCRRLAMEHDDGVVACCRALK